MTSVPTVRGRVDTSQLGATLMREHFFVLTPEIMLTYPEVSGDEDRRARRSHNRRSDRDRPGPIHSVHPTVWLNGPRSTSSSPQASALSTTFRFIFGPAPPDAMAEVLYETSPEALAKQASEPAF